MKVRSVIRAGAVVATSAALAGVGGGMGLTAAHSSNQTTSTSTAKVSQPALSSRLDTVCAPSSGSKSIGPNYVVGGGGGGGDTYSEIEITPLELAIAANYGVGAVGFLAGVGCATFWSGVGAVVCGAMIAGTASAIYYVMDSGSFPYIYIWWNDTTNSYAGYTIVQ